MKFSAHGCVLFSRDRIAEMKGKVKGDKRISVFRRLPESESLHVVACPSKSQAGGRDPAIYVLIKHFLAVFLSLLYYSAKYSLRSP